LALEQEQAEFDQDQHQFYKRVGLPALIIAAIVYGLFFIFWIFLTIMLVLSYTPFDALFAYITICLYPLFALGCLGAGFVLYRKNRFQPAFFILFLPLLNICMLFVSFAQIWP